MGRPAAPDEGEAGLARAGDLPFRGHGDSSRLRLKGRVLESGGLDKWEAGASAWSNLARMLHRFESDEVPGARVRAAFGGREVQVTTDEEGYFEVRLNDLDGLDTTPIGDQRWREVELELLEPLRGDRRNHPHAIAQVLMPPGLARLGVISDIDDTIIKTGATELVRNWPHDPAQQRRGPLPVQGASPPSTVRSSKARTGDPSTRSSTSPRAPGTSTTCSSASLP